jgi:hypothetical protein
VLALLPALPSLAQSDTSASAPEGFRDAVLASQGVVLRVPINERGEENTAASEMRLSSVAVADGSAIESAFAAAQPIGAEAVIAGGESSDSSTCGWYSWNGSYGNSWASPYYYSSYTPSYTYYDTTYSYSYSYSYTTRYSSYTPSYRYYYYPRSSYGYGGNYYNWYY